MLWLLIACQADRIDADDADAPQGAPIATESPAKPDPAPPPPDQPPLALPVSDADWAALRTAKLEDLGRFIPHHDEAGAPEGYRITGVRLDSLPDRLGLKNGDILLALRPSGQGEWIKLGDPAATPDKLRALLDSPAVDLRIQRQGEALERTYTRGPSPAELPR